MGVLDSSYKKALGVKSPGLKTISLIFSDTSMHRYNICGLHKESPRCVAYHARKGCYQIAGNGPWPALTGRVGFLALCTATSFHAGSVSVASRTPTCADVPRDNWSETWKRSSDYNRTTMVSLTVMAASLLVSSRILMGQILKHPVQSTYTRTTTKRYF